MSSKKPYNVPNRSKNNKKKQSKKSLEATTRIRVDDIRLNDSESLDTSFLEGRIEKQAQKDKKKVSERILNDNKKKLVAITVLKNIFVCILLFTFLAFLIFFITDNIKDFKFSNFFNNQKVEENLGGIGAVIGHEISHAFDNNGAHFDAYGNLANWWSENIANFYFTVVGPSISWFPLSVTEIYFVVIGIIIIISIVKLIRLFIKKDIAGGLGKVLKIANIVIATVLTYTISCEFAYNRSPVDLPFYNEKIDNSEFKDIYNYFAKDLNYCMSRIEFGSDGDVHVNNLRLL